jgi:hypothetical protein
MFGETRINTEKQLSRLERRKRMSNADIYNLLKGVKNGNGSLYDGMHLFENGKKKDFPLPYAAAQRRHHRIGERSTENGS